MSHSTSRLRLVAALAALGLSVVNGASLAATLTVTSVADAGPGSLRQAVIDAEATPAADVIRFAVGGTITLLAQLPDVNGEGGALTIDGTGKEVTIRGNGRRVIYVNDGAHLSLANLTIADGAGGAIYSRGRLDVAGSTFRNNVNALNGGAIFNNNSGVGPGILTITNSTFSGNAASDGGGAVFNAAGITTIRNSTFVGNTAGSGGGVGTDEGGTTTTLINTILAGNVGGNCGGTGETTNGGGNIEDGATCGWGSADGSKSSTNPLLGPLTQNAPGTSPTFALLPGSPAIDGGKNAGCTDTDQRGIARPQGTACDVGAYEAAQPAINVGGMWWNAPAGSESGWGINFAHQGDIVFATWFTFGQDGKPMWLVVAANKTGAGVYSGTLYTGTGPAFSVLPYDPGAVAPVAVGNATFTFADSNSGSFAYTVNGVSQTKAITRQVFGPALPTCTWGGQPDFAQASNFQDMWWSAPAGSEPGWGINFAHQGDTIFATWFTFGQDGRTLWLVVGAPKTGANVYSGTLYTATGPAFDAVPFDSTKVEGGPVGNATFTFADGNHATFASTVNGIAQTRQITREVFAAPGTLCH